MKVRPPRMRSMRNPIRHLIDTAESDHTSSVKGNMAAFLVVTLAIVAMLAGITLIIIAIENLPVWACGLGAVALWVVGYFYATSGTPS